MPVILSFKTQSNIRINLFQIKQTVKKLPKLTRIDINLNDQVQQNYNCQVLYKFLSTGLLTKTLPNWNLYYNQSILSDLLKFCYPLL